VTKNVVNTGGGTLGCTAFSFSVNGGVAVPFDDDCAVTVPLTAGAYAVTEPAVADYTPTYGAGCSGTASAGSYSCTITNTYSPGATLTVTKRVVGGSPKAACTAFSFRVAGTTYPFDADCSVTVTIPLGAYTVTEPVVADTYTAFFGSGCSGTATSGGSYTCTITNLSYGGSTCEGWSD